MEDFKNEVENIICGCLLDSDRIVDWYCMDTTQGLICEVIVISANHNVYRYIYGRNDGNGVKLLDNVIFERG